MTVCLKEGDLNVKSLNLQVRMLGTFSVTLNGESIDDNENRSRKVWLLLAYMIYRRRDVVTQEELFNLLWNGEQGSTNPANALKTIFYRVRSTLNQLYPDVGHNLIVRRGGNYAWNREANVRLDIEEFEALYQKGQQEEEKRLDCYRRAVELYRGDFLEKISSESWVSPIAVHFHNCYVRLTLELLSLLERHALWEEAVELCRRAMAVEPYHEILCRHWMNALLQLGRHKEAIAVFESVSQRLSDDLGVMPSEQLLSLYREAVRTVNDRAIPFDVLLEQLQEPDPVQGAMICDYDFFKVLYRAEARTVSRSGNAVHIALLTVRGEGGRELAKRSLDRAMDNLQEQIRLNLRQDDIASKCSVTQYILLLPQANYENSCMVCQRVIKAFCRQYPHSPAEVTYSVHPLNPII